MLRAVYPERSERAQHDSAIFSRLHLPSARQAAKPQVVIEGIDRSLDKFVL